MSDTTDIPASGIRANDIRVWHVTYMHDGRRMLPHATGCVCDEWKGGAPHFHIDGKIKRQPDHLIRKPCDPLYDETHARLAEAFPDPKKEA
jgi:hypothetical protein